MQFIANHFLSYLAGELYVLAYWTSWAISALLLGAFFFVAKFVYRNFGLEFINLDGIYRPFELTFYKTFAFYCLWALAQQFIVTFVLFLTGVYDLPAYLFCVLVFSCTFHFGNSRLMVATAMFGTVVYLFYVFLAGISVFQIAILHAFMGTSYKLLGWDMRVWRLK